MSNALEIDVDSLFENYSISEIDQIQRRLQTEVDKKREELRTMVSEKYRDLLKAADAIIEMKDSSSYLINDVQNIIDHCKSLNEKQLIGFKTEQQLDKPTERMCTLYYGTVEQIRILTLMPKLIWEKLDSEQYFMATQFYILARHINTGLQLDINNEFMNCFPVAKFQWKYQTESFYSILKECAIKALESENLKSETAIDCLLTIYLLDKDCGNNILKIFLDIRAKTYLNCLKSDQYKQKRVKDRILSSLNILISTIHLMYDIFFNDLPMERRIKNLSKAPTLDLLEFSNEKMRKLLPEIISNFRPNLESPYLSKDTVEKSINIWLNEITEICNKQLKNIIKLITSMKIIKDIKVESVAMIGSSNWTEKCKECGLPGNLDFYVEKYQPLINERTREIIKQTWTKCNDETYKNIMKALKNFQKQRYNSIWTENLADNPGSLKQALTQDNADNKLLMRIKGFNSAVLDICTSFDKELHKLFQEINILLDESINEKNEEKSILLEFLKENSEKETLNLITMLKRINEEKNYEFYGFLAKIMIGLIELCPNYKLCLSYSYLATDKRNIAERWTKICSLLEEESFELWKKYCDHIFEEFLENNGVETELGQKILLEDLVNWDTVTIEDKDEQGEIVTSTIRIPSQPRISVQNFLFRIIKFLSEKIPQTLPTKVMYYFTIKIMEYLFNQYTIMVSKEFCSTNQNISLQLYFDLKFLQTYFLSREEKKLFEEFQKLAMILKAYIDPFDFELFHSYLSQNIKKCCLRMHQYLGLCNIQSETLNIKLTKDNKISVNSSDKDPNVLTLSSSGSNSTWFPLLPVISTAVPEKKNHSKIEKNAGNKLKRINDPTKSQNNQLTMAQNYASNVKSGAAAFFGAMSQDWFR